MTDWLKQHWFLITAFASMSAAWGQQQYRVTTIEEAVKQNVIVQEEVDKLKQQNAKIEERTQRMIDNQENQQRMLELLLQNQRSLIKTK